MEKIEVNEIIKRLKNGELDNPDELSNFLVVLSASLWTAGNFELDADIACAGKWQEIKPTCKTDRECDQKIKLTEEYKLWQQTRIANKTTQECIKSLKKKLAQMNFEYQSGVSY